MILITNFKIKFSSVLKLSFILSMLLVAANSGAQELPVEELQKQISLYKSNVRGPYKSIQWFCNDGSLREARDPCPDSIGGGVQHASYRDDTKNWGKSHHLYFGEILANTDPIAFWDEDHQHSRIKQYQLGKYLGSIDNGWIQQKSQFYRGAFQIEDEQEWGLTFYKQLLKKSSLLDGKYFLLRQTLRDIPHDGDSNLAQLMRSQSKNVADAYPKFMDARIKIHGNPSSEDIKMVADFQSQHKAKMPAKVLTELEDLQKTMLEIYAPMDTVKLLAEVKKLPKDAPLTKELVSFLSRYDNSQEPGYLVTSLSNILCNIRSEITFDSSARNRLILLDISNSLEDALLVKTQQWQPERLSQLLKKIHDLSLAAAGTGLIELWEWNAIEHTLASHQNREDLSLEELNEYLTTARAVVEWSAGMVKANYEDVVSTYTLFEPRSYGFIDDRIRSSIALNLGESVSKLGGFVSEKSNVSNQVLSISSQSSIRGLNPGYAFGELVVVKGSPENIAINTEKIYVFMKPPSDLKPVAGIMTVSEGNLVSHVQLLARNLGIPNAALSAGNLDDLYKFDGKKVFYAVSEKGNVIIKLEKDMSEIEQALFSKKERNTDKIAVPVEQIRLDVQKVLNMREVDASNSGRLCGPKAANLGQLKAMFPENVVEGLIIPFGIFKKHMDKQMPNTNNSYWSYLSTTFKEADLMRASNKAEREVEEFQLKRLNQLRLAIEKIELDPSFVSNLKSEFAAVFGNRIGRVPVFLRSDTNMEDLKEFTGAGLNLTLFNILSEEKIIEGIKKVWASPYTERSFKWRQKYLSNPENVYPSILIIPSVDVEYSGVLITKGINKGTNDDLTIAFSRGAGGAVDGQIAETRLVTAKYNMLLAPAREMDYLRLPVTGGTSKNTTTFEEAIIKEQNLNDIRAMARKVRTTLYKTNEEYQGAWDVELGFKDDKLWLFQIRPFVENKRAKSSSYLNSITPKIDYTTRIELNSNI